MSAAKAALPMFDARAASRPSTALLMALIPGVVMMMRSRDRNMAARGNNAHHRSEPRALSPHAELSGPTADHPRRLEDARGGVRRVRKRPGQQRDVLLDAGSWRHAHRCAAPFRQNRDADRRVSAGNLHRP